MPENDGIFFQSWGRIEGSWIPACGVEVVAERFLYC